eukprot:TRINITY_DN26095_c0_g1_i1.p1 TRINITY_DN26095_c0_g1~~TRINITY_DN26095_c0_g1_i1.p1  ORF type:complete len:429 (+),score=28.94 TRINITY_DN26095_c0_g1_i1:92-1378(+)
MREDTLVDVHTLWIGSELPDWVPLCVKSYLNTGHKVSWWVYSQERRADLERLQIRGGILDHTNLRIRDADRIMPFERASKMYYQGMGPEGKWQGWAPFSDWFRYEVLARYGGWWVDADGVSVRNLRDLTPSLDSGTSLVVCTEMHRLDRRSLGAVGVAFPGSEAKSTVSVTPEIPTGLSQREQIQKYRSWIDLTFAAGLDVCLVTNNHIFVAQPKSLIMLELAKTMLALLEKYAAEVESHGVEAVKQLRNGSSWCAISSGLVGMQEYQRCVRRLLEKTSQSEGLASQIRPQLLHWAVFNPVSAKDPLRMHRVLAGRETLKGSWVRSVHIFRQVRDEWKTQRLGLPSMTPVTSDENPPAEELRPPREKRESRTQVPIVVREVPAPTGWLLKRYKSASGRPAPPPRAEVAAGPSASLPSEFTSAEAEALF